MSSVGMRGMISNNAGAPHYFQKRDSGDATSANDAAAAGRRRVSAVYLPCRNSTSSLLLSISSSDRFDYISASTIAVYYTAIFLLLSFCQIVVLFNADNVTRVVLPVRKTPQCQA